MVFVVPLLLNSIQETENMINPIISNIKIFLGIFIAANWALKVIIHLYLVRGEQLSLFFVKAIAIAILEGSLQIPV